jgi:hypothetical protein
LDAVGRNVEVVRRLEDAFNARNYAVLPEVIVETFDGHNPGGNDVTIEGL